jgi:hypothetical protein
VQATSLFALRKQTEHQRDLDDQENKEKVAGQPPVQQSTSFGLQSCCALLKADSHQRDALFPISPRTLTSPHIRMQA